ncbi:MAG: stage III sporulation protein AA [Firmicutes bacterium]|nr:stage III sporulation protein AA [Bacillota bacterium]
MPLWSDLEEIRLRLGRPLALRGRRGDCFLGESGEAASAAEAYRPQRSDLERALQLISSSSLYAFAEELRSGYITIPGGHRVGLCGQAVVEGGRVVRLKHITGLNYRVARQIRGVARPYIRFFLDERRRRVCHTLLVAPPRGGKTTFLRDLARCLSSGARESGLAGFNVAVVDERSEIAGSFQGMPQLDVGERTDVLDACPKAEGMMLLLRSMGPEIIVTDEIGRPEDAAAIEEVIHAGVSVVATAHGSSLEELRARPALRRLLDEAVFEKALLLGCSRGPGTVEQLCDLRKDKLARRA